MCCQKFPLNYKNCLASFGSAWCLKRSDCDLILVNVQERYFQLIVWCHIFLLLILPHELDWTAENVIRSLTRQKLKRRPITHNFRTLKSDIIKEKDEKKKNSRQEIMYSWVGAYKVKFLLSKILNQKAFTILKLGLTG